MFSIIPGKESDQRTSDKVENEATNIQTRTSTNLRRVERKQNAFPTTTNIYYTSHSKSHYTSYHVSS